MLKLHYPTVTKTILERRYPGKPTLKVAFGNDNGAIFENSSKLRASLFVTSRWPRSSGQTNYQVHHPPLRMTKGTPGDEVAARGSGQKSSRMLITFFRPEPWGRVGENPGNEVAFFCGPSSKTRDTQMATRVTDFARRERHKKRETTRKAKENGLSRSSDFLASKLKC